MASSPSQATDHSPDKLFSLPLAKGSIALPGISHQSSKKLLQLVKEDYEKWHVYFDVRGFHNHLTHHLYAIYDLGAPPSLIEAVNKTHQYQVPAFKGPEPITEDNFVDHLGDHTFYASYLAFFSSYLITHTPTQAIERFIFLPQLNYNPDLKEGQNQPAMLDRFHSGLLHPLIHLGYGLEFGVLGQVAEGLAQCAIHPSGQTAIFPDSIFSASLAETDSLLSNIASRLSLSPVQAGAVTPLRPSFALWHQIVKDPSLAPEASIDVTSAYSHVLKNKGKHIYDLVLAWHDNWLKGAESEAEVEKRLESMLEEVIIGNVLWFGVGGWTGRGKNDAGKEINADFFLMHLVTSALFLPIYVLPTSSSQSPHLLLPHRLLLLRSFLATSAVWYIARGRPSLPIASFYISTTSHLSAPVPPERKTTVPITERPPAAWPGEVVLSGPNPWMRILQDTLVHPNEHLCKLQRALAYFAQRYGDREAGYYASGMDGAEALDGTLFVRIAGLVQERMGWANEGKELGIWDRGGFFQ